MGVILRASRLLLDSSSEVIEQGVVIVNDGRISKAGSWTDLKDDIPASQEIRDLGNVTLMPGLFDCHVSSPTNFVEASEIYMQL